MLWILGDDKLIFDLIFVWNWLEVEFNLGEVFFIFEVEIYRFEKKRVFILFFNCVNKVFLFLVDIDFLIKFCEFRL